MAVRSGPARREKPRTRPHGVGQRAVWDDAGLRWREDAFWFDERAADLAVAFFPEKLCFTTGEWAGRPFVLEDWEANDIIRPAFGWKRADGTRRYRRVFVWIPRKNGKTELAAGIALLVLVGDAEEGGEVYAIASEKDQARIVFDKATAMVGKSSSLSEHLECLKPSIYCPALNASFKPLSGKPEGKHGFNMSGLVGDEIHEWKSGDLYTFIHDSSATRRQPFEFMISTAGKKGGYGEEVWEECVKIRDGVIDDPETLVVIYAAAPDDDWTDPKVWAKANPNLGKSVKLERVETDCKRARQLPRLENDFKRYRLNMWTEQTVRWLPIDAIDDEGNKFGWDHCIGPRPWQELEEVVRGKTCFGGLDLSSTTDLSALIWWFPIQPGLDVPVVLARFFKPQLLIKTHATRDKLPYERWVAEGALFATSGNVIDYGFIRRRIYADAEKFRVAHVGNHLRKPDEGGIAVDRWNATDTAVQLEEQGLPVVLMGQGFASLSAPSKELERLVTSNGFHHGGHPVLRRHAQVVAVEDDAADNIKPAKHKSTERVDGIAALVNGIGISLRGIPNNGSLDDFLAQPVMVA
jgi:phage terminase large subunit-like protein